MSDINEGRSQIKRQYGEYAKIRVNEKAPIRNKILDFVGKRFVTEEEMKSHLTKITEEIGKDFDQRKWFKNNQKYFESFENRGQKVWTLSKYGKRVHEFINKPKDTSVNENAEPVRIGLFKTSLFESTSKAIENEFETEINEGSLAGKGFGSLDSVDTIMGEFDDENVIQAHQASCDALKEDPSNVCRIDSETAEDDPISDKIYDYLNSHFKGTDEVKGYKVSSGEDLRLDPRLGVVRYDDYGFVCYFFTSKSNF